MQGKETETAVRGAWLDENGLGLKRLGVGLG